MNRHSDERIAQLQARAQAQRLAAQLAILEAREQLAPLRSAYGAVSAAARLFSSERDSTGVVGTLARFGLGHPWLSSALTAAALRTARRQPVGLALAVVGAAAAWWLLRRPPEAAGQDSRGP